jgi:hypothetical protein
MIIYEVILFEEFAKKCIIELDSVVAAASNKFLNPYRGVKK